MSDDLHHPAQCDAIADELTELALGTLSGPRRAEVLDHVESCQRCRAELEQLSVVIEAVQQLAPRVQPPLGFETRVAEKLRALQTVKPRRRRIGVLAAVAAALVVLAFGLGTLAAPRAGDGTEQSSGSDVVRTEFWADGQVVGDLFVANGTPGWMFVTIHDGDWRGTVHCDVTMAGGQVETVGVFKLSGEYGAWATPLPWSGAKVRTAQLIASNGTVVASARF